MLAAGGLLRILAQRKAFERDDSAEWGGFRRAVIGTDARYAAERGAPAVVAAGPWRAHAIGCWKGRMVVSGAGTHSHLRFLFSAGARVAGAERYRFRHLRHRE